MHPCHLQHTSNIKSKCLWFYSWNFQGDQSPYNPSWSYYTYLATVACGAFWKYQGWISFSTPTSLFPNGSLFRPHGFLLFSNGSLFSQSVAHPWRTYRHLLFVVKSVQTLYIILSWFWSLSCRYWSSILTISHILHLHVTTLDCGAFWRLFLGWVLRWWEQ